MQNTTAHDAEWPDEEFARRAPVIASDVARLLADEPRWVHRRVETLTFNDDSSVRRQTSVDFTIPGFVEPTLHAADGRTVYVPLSLIEKRVLVNLDIRDETGAALSTIPRAQNADVAAHLLLQQAEEALRACGDPPELLEPNARSLRALAGDLDEPLERDVDDPETIAQAKVIVDDEVAQGFMQELAESFILLIPIETRMRTHRVLKFAYDASFERFDRPGAIERVLEVLALRRFQTGFTLPAVADGASYHAELVFPDELIATAELVEYHGSNVVGVRDSQAGAGRLHLYGGTGSASIEWAALFVRFGLRAGLVAPVFLLSAVTTVTLLGGLVAHYWWDPPTGDTAGTLVVALPTFFAPVVAPGSHRLVRRMFRGLRALVFLSALISFTATATLALDLPADAPIGRAVAWIGLAATSGTLTIATGAALARAPRGP